MAQKAILNISNYSGGLNNHTNARDIEGNQFQDIDSLSIDIPGKLKVMGATADFNPVKTLTISGSTFTPTVGNGLFYFKPKFYWMVLALHINIRNWVSLVDPIH